ncbi:hypothetical protein BUY12_11010 [Staphylococcus chromogenes]|uniref:hypothetical protein n=1 Tax=Staphylococcus chromogenes TaxID=46126 RepID=UPI000D1CE392|nr:hypothetical protein [Staphylococcus chromogenes]PTF49801.1 hypothetical protein BUY12_11010 [Staphylococcus chromogenes]
MNFIKQYPAISFVLGIIAIIILVIINRNLNSDSVEGEWTTEPNSAGETSTYKYKNDDLELEIKSSSGDVIYRVDYKYKIIKEDEKETIVEIYYPNDEKVFRKKFVFSEDHDEAVVYTTGLLDDKEVEGGVVKLTKE